MLGKRFNDYVKKLGNKYGQKLLNRNLGDTLTKEINPRVTSYPALIAFLIMYAVGCRTTPSYSKLLVPVKPIKAPQQPKKPKDAQKPTLDAKVEQNHPGSVFNFAQNGRLYPISLSASGTNGKIDTIREFNLNMLGQINSQNPVYSRIMLRGDVNHFNNSRLKHLKNQGSYKDDITRIMLGTYWLINKNKKFGDNTWALGPLVEGTETEFKDTGRDKETQRLGGLSILYAGRDGLQLKLDALAGRGKGSFMNGYDFTQRDITKFNSTISYLLSEEYGLVLTGEGSFESLKEKNRYFGLYKQKTDGSVSIVKSFNYNDLLHAVELGVHAGNSKIAGYDINSGGPTLSYRLRVPLEEKGKVKGFLEFLIGYKRTDYDASKVLDKVLRPHGSDNLILGVALNF